MVSVPAVAAETPTVSVAKAVMAIRKRDENWSFMENSSRAMRVGRGLWGENLRARRVYNGLREFATDVYEIIAIGGPRRSGRQWVSGRQESLVKLHKDVTAHLKVVIEKEAVAE